MSLTFAIVLAAVGSPSPPAPGHFRHTRRGEIGPASAPVGGEAASFVMGGRRYYWFVSGGRRVYSSHPPAGYRPATGPVPGGSTPAGPSLGGVSDLDATLSPSEQAAQSARMRQAQARLASLEHRIGRLRHLERLRAHPAHVAKKHP